jgi:hypothetical protein
VPQVADLEPSPPAAVGPPGLEQRLFLSAGGAATGLGFHGPGRVVLFGVAFGYPVVNQFYLRWRLSMVAGAAWRMCGRFSDRAAHPAAWNVVIAGAKYWAVRHRTFSH